MEDKKHWYDGKFYDQFIAPNQDKIFEKIIELIPKGSNVLDIGCGTGRLPFQLSSKCDKVLGVDLSEKNIKLANQKLGSSDITNISFTHNSVTELNFEKQYDYGIMTFVLHEIPAANRIEVLKKIGELTKTFLIADYSIKNRSFYNKVLNELVEFAAGWDHYSNYKNYIKKGGMEYFLEAAGFTYKTVITDIGFSADIIEAKLIN